MSAFDELQQEIQGFDELLDPIANAEVDINDPDWQKKLKESQHPLDEAGIRKAVGEATQRLIELFLASNSKERDQIRKLLADNGSFAWAMVVPGSGDPGITFRDSVLLVVMDDTCDTRDAIIGIGALVDQARAKGVDYGPIMRQIAKVAGTRDRYGFGSMRTIIENHC
ncbi:hypothetical protein [Haloferula sp.]|uniref:hypothetical protein n=1 Tax=Haloferula sp. TaxID=2497595 RepID=UPI00329D3511